MWQIKRATRTSVPIPGYTRRFCVCLSSERGGTNVWNTLKGNHLAHIDVCTCQTVQLSQSSSIQNNFSLPPWTSFCVPTSFNFFSKIRWLGGWLSDRLFVVCYIIDIATAGAIVCLVENNNIICKILSTISRENTSGNATIKTKDVCYLCWYYLQSKLLLLWKQSPLDSHRPFKALHTIPESSGDIS